MLGQIDTPELEPTNILDEWQLDWSIYSLKHSVWINRHELWRKFLRSE